MAAFARSRATVHVNIISIDRSSCTFGLSFARSLFTGGSGYVEVSIDVFEPAVAFYSSHEMVCNWVPSRLYD